MCFLTLVASAVQEIDFCALSSLCMSISHRSDLEPKSFQSCLLILVDVLVVIRALDKLKLVHGNVDVDVDEGARALFQDKPQQD